jgi:hypothetical protein
VAFKILSQEEIAVLNEHEKKAYEQAYQEYLERTAFVERLEQLDKVRMPQVSVKRKGIKKIKPPVIPTMKTQSFAVDSQMGVSLLNAAKKIKLTADNNAKLTAKVNYRASLPSVLIPAPETVKVREIAPFVITKSASVPITEPSAIKREIKKYNVSTPKIESVTMPKLTGVIIKDYSISGIPSINTELPPMPQVNSVLNFTASLPNIEVVAPNVESVKIKEYKASQLAKNTVKTPIVDYTEPEVRTVKLSAVPIPDYHSIPTVVEDPLVEIPTIDSISTPNVTVKVETAKVKPLKDVCIPSFAPEVHIDASTVTTIRLPACSAPNEIHYTEPSCSIEITPVPVISVPHIDVNAALETIMSKIR